MADTNAYEAEAAANTLTGSAGRYGCSPCSGSQDVGFLGFSSQLTFNGINSAASGNLQVTVYYANGAGISLGAAISADGGAPVWVSFAPTGGWWDIQSVSLTLPGNAGSNTINVANANDWIADIDKITVTSPGTKSNSTNTVLITAFGVVGHGGNDTAVFLKGLSQTAANGNSLEVPAGNYNLDPLDLPSNSSIVLDAGANFLATSGYALGTPMINIYDVNNISITGVMGQSIFAMRKWEYTSGESRHCLRIEGATNVNVSGIQCNSSGGDGLYISNSNNVTVTDSGFDNNRRAGFSLIAGSNITIDGDSFTNTNGTSPQHGINVEPNNSNGQLNNIVIQNSVSSGNAGDGFSVSLWETSPSMSPISITVSNFRTAYNAGAGYRLRNEHDDGSGGAGGYVLIQNSSSTNDAEYGAVAHFWDMPGPSAKFQNMTITNANTDRSDWDGAALGVIRGGSDCCSTGNVTFTGTSVSGYLSHYFTVENYSGGSVQNVCIGNWGTLSGASGSKGVYLGGAVDSVQIGNCP
jgi:hypothetical protein